MLSYFKPGSQKGNEIESTTVATVVFDRPTTPPTVPTTGPSFTITRDAQGRVIGFTNTPSTGTAPSITSDQILDLLKTLGTQSPTTRSSIDLRMQGSSNVDLAAHQ